MTQARRGKRGRPIVPERETWRLDRDARYASDLARHPEAAEWLAKFDHELVYGTRWRRRDEPTVHTIEQVRELDAERKARERNPDVLDVQRGPALEAIAEAGGDPDAFLARHTGVEPGAEEDAAIARIDEARAVALRRGDE